MFESIQPSSVVQILGFQNRRFLCSLRVALWPSCSTRYRGEIGVSSHTPATTSIKTCDANDLVQLLLESGHTSATGPFFWGFISSKNLTKIHLFDCDGK